MSTVSFKHYNYLQNICNIQQKFISKQIRKKDFLEQIEKETQRYLLELKQENEKIKQEIAFNTLFDNISDILNGKKGEN